MAQVNAGRVRFIGRGEYDNSTQYYTFDLVNYNGNSYFAKSNTMGNHPTNSTYWQLVAEKGNIGPAGPTGNGIDHISLTSQSGATKVYTIYFTDGNTTTFTVEDGEVTQEVFDEEVDRLKMVYNAMPKVSDEGTDLTLDNTAECPVYDVELSPSELEQESTSGYQLFDKNGRHYDVGVNVTTLDTGIRVTLTQASNYRNTAFVIGGSELLGKTITQKTMITPSASNVGAFYIFLGNASSTSVERIIGTAVGDNTRQFPIPSSFPENCDTVYMICYGNTTGESQVGDYVDYTDLMITEGAYTSTTMPEYEPFTNGASPNPQYPQEIHTVSGDNTITISNSDNTQSQTYSLSLGDLEYCKIGDYEDLFFKNVIGSEYYDSTLELDKWYLKKNIGKIINNDLAISYNSTYGYYILNVTNAGGQAKTNSRTFSTHFGNVSPITPRIVGSNGYNLWLWDNNNYFSNSSEIKQFMIDNNVGTYYQLRTPQNILLSDTLQNQLDNIQKAITYQDQTNVSQTNNDLPFVIKLSAIRDLSGIFELIQG